MKIRPAKHIYTRAGRFLFAAMLVLLPIATVLTDKISAFDYVRLPNRSLTIGDTTPAATTSYVFSWQYPTATTLGSIKLLLCTDPYVLDTCTLTSGDFSAATLTGQSGVTGFSILSQSAGEIILSRAPSGGSNIQSTYSFANIDNPGGLPDVFYVRIWTYPTADATGPPNEISSVATATTEVINITTIVPPILFFCTGLTVDNYCQNVVGNQIDYGDLSSTSTDFATSQFGVATNAVSGYVVTINGNTMTSGNKAITALNAPAAAAVGVGQFGLNLRANTAPPVGQDTTGAGTGVVDANYNNPDQYQFNDGDLVANAATGTLFNTFTSSYIVNVPPDQPAGVYSTTIVYICTASF
ncbi:hypothetical protein H0V99_02020 [Candidatus Saccharibacteria bacterium]|nr:hypothetical protein [Candidatus Saccharibacteria bacterium]